MKAKIRKNVRVFLNAEREKTPVPVVADGAVATTIVGEGRLAPVLILDTSARPDIDELVRLHHHLPPGDVNCTWGKIDRDKERIDLLLQFRRPADVAIILEFDVLRHCGIVDMILTSRFLYLQPGHPGDRFANNINADKIIVEVPDTGIDAFWEKLLRKTLFMHVKRSGLNRPEAKNAVNEYLKSWRRFTKLRATG